MNDDDPWIQFSENFDRPRGLESSNDYIDRSINLPYNEEESFHTGPQQEQESLSPYTTSSRNRRHYSNHSLIDQSITLGPHMLSPKLDLSGSSDPSNGGFAGDRSLIMAATANGANGAAYPTPITNGNHSPSTDTSDCSSNGDANPSQHPSPTESSQAPPMHLGMALSHAGIDAQNGFPAFPGNDIFFQNNGLLPYPMLPGFASRHMQSMSVLDSCLLDLTKFSSGIPSSSSSQSIPFSDDLLMPATLGFDTKPDIHAIQSQMQMREAKPYKCTQCIKSFANSSYLSQHMRIHLGIKPFGPCQFCGKKFTQLSHLQQHIRTHTGEKPYKCKYVGCEKAFSQLSNLQSHSRCHQSDKPFKCNSCYKCFADEQSLLEHIPKHKESKHLKSTKVHICPFCGKSYTQATYLSKHMTKHADRTRNMNYPVDPAASGGGNPLEQLHWNGGLPAMPDDTVAQQQAQQLAFSQFANAGMMQAATQSYPQINNSAFTQLINFQRNSRSYLDYNGFAKPSDRPAGFNMITPLENIQRYTQQAVVNGQVPATSTANGHATTFPVQSSTVPSEPSNSIRPNF